MRELARLLREFPFFVDMPAEDLAQIVSCATEQRFSAGLHLFHEGEPADRLYLVRQGRVALELYVPGKGALYLDSVEAGEIVGLSWLFPPHRWQMDARAVTDLRMIAIDGTSLRCKCKTDPRLGYELMQRLSHVAQQRMQSARLRLLDLYGRAGSPVR